MYSSAVVVASDLELIENTTVKYKIASAIACKGEGDYLHHRRESTCRFESYFRTSAGVSEKCEKVREQICGCVKTSERQQLMHAGVEFRKCVEC